MMIHDVPRAEWPEFLERFSREPGAWLATVHGIERGMPMTRVPSARLKALTLVGDIPTGTLRLTLANGISLCAPRPCALRVQQTDDWMERALEIETLDGALIRIAFRAVARPDQLDGLAPGEMPPESPTTGSARDHMVLTGLRVDRV
jgi:hypothetical protein